MESQELRRLQEELRDRRPEELPEPTALVGSIQKFSIEDGPGIRTTVFLKGCPLNCAWCHNPELISFEQQLIQSPNNCIGCGACALACPEGAISLVAAADCAAATDGAAEMPADGAPEAGPNSATADPAVDGAAQPQPFVRIDRARCTVCLACADECYARALRPVAKPMTISQVMDVVEQDRGFYDNTGGGMTISGGELLAHARFAKGLLDEASRRGIAVCLDTSGYGSYDTLRELAAHSAVTHVLFDIKSVDDGIHQAYTGVSNRVILENLRRLSADGQIAGKLIVRMPLIAGVNDGDDVIVPTAELVRDLGLKTVSLLAYHNLGVAKKRNIGGSMREFSAPSDDRLTEIVHTLADIAGASAEVLGRV